ncbi:MAG: biopolymer transporter ExbD [Akkermansiaceae bacterium]|nr:biopolymer transporter ExbD [Akkermansiaceae bacterium]MCF7732226.1 biopolymer transporter ExbD [Akkermansiaceae bacterium]
MARHKHYATEQDDEPKMDISSLIDVCFLMLIYFLVTSAIQVRETDLKLQTAGDRRDPTPTEIQPLFIRVESSGLVSVGHGMGQQALDADPAVRELPLLGQALQLYQAASRSAMNRPLVQLWVDDGANQQRVVDVINALAAKEIDSIAFTDR